MLQTVITKPHTFLQYMQHLIVRLAVWQPYCALTARYSMKKLGQMSINNGTVVNLTHIPLISSK